MVLKNFSGIVIVIGTFLTITINLLANLLPFNNKTTAQLSDQYDILFVPAGYVFSIWGLIYVLLLVFCFSHFFTKNNDFLIVFRKIFPFHLLGLFLNITWIILWHYEQVELSVLIMLALLISLIKIYQMIQSSNLNRSSEFLILKSTFSIYLGWISVATVVNITVVLFKNQFLVNLLLPEAWSSLLIFLSGFLAIIFSVRRDFLYSLVIIWALIGIAYKFSTVSLIKGLD